jgi:hypothetical protein
VPPGASATSKAIRSWTTKEARLVFEWARTPVENRPPIDIIAGQLGRSPGAVQQFLRRVLPKGQRPWPEKRRWAREEIEALENGRRSMLARSRAAIKKYSERHRNGACENELIEEALERTSLTVTQVAADLGLSRASVYRLLKNGVLRRFKGGIAETSFTDLLREHPEVVPYSKLARDQKEWLVLNGYSDPSLQVKRPTTKGILD